MKFEASEEELKIRETIRNVYNSGNCAEAVRLSIEFFRDHPNCLLAHYSFAVMQGDYSYDPSLSLDERTRLREIGNAGVKKLFDDPDRSTWPDDFQKSVRNEYYWFFELPDEQYKLGLEDSAKDSSKGLYSMTVGASMMALKTLRTGDVRRAQEWAARSIASFKKFEMVAPDWYNINHFSAQAYACLGQFAEAEASLKDMFRKQKAPINQLEVEKFQKLANEIKALLSA